MTKFNIKVLLLMVIPVILGMSAIIYWVSHQTQGFSILQAQEFKLAIVDHRKKQLRDYVSIVQSAVSHLHSESSPDANNDKTKELIRILNTIEFSEDGYFYVYDTQGNSIVHPRQPYRVGENWIDLTDSRGKKVISSLLAQAQAGGGYTEYIWEKPSLGEEAKKIGYSEMLGSHHWMIGTGAYFDDIDNQVTSVQQAMAPHIKKTLETGAFIASAAVIFVFIGGLLLQLNEKRLADSKQRELTRRIVLSQDEERRRVSRELHDSISQSLVGVKYLLEDIDTDAIPDPKAIQSFKLAASHLDQTLTEVTRISRNLHPSILDDIGLMAAVEALVEGFRKRTLVNVTFNSVKVRNLLPEDARTAMYRVVQEALTNIERHSGATSASITFDIRDKWFGVKITDNGVGMHNKQQQRHHSVQRGIGLRNISERLSYLNGVCEISSSSSGTKLFAGVPKTMLRRPINNWN